MSEKRRDDGTAEGGGRMTHLRAAISPDELARRKQALADTLAETFGHLLTQDAPTPKRRAAHTTTGKRHAPTEGEPT